MDASQSDASGWTPGRLVVTPEEHAAWQEWKRGRKLEQQRQRRAKLRRIDYYPSPEAAKVIDALTRPIAHADHSSVINGIVTEWASGIK